MGLLCRALVHVETLQLMDIPLLIEHIAYVLSKSGAGGADYPQMQEAIVLFYFSSLMKHAEKLNNIELLARVCENHLVARVTTQILDIVQSRPPGSNMPEVAVAVAEGFAATA